MARRSSSRTNFNKFIKFVSWAVYLAPIGYGLYTLIRDSGMIEKAQPYIDGAKEKAEEVVQSAKDAVANSEALDKALNLLNETVEQAERNLGKATDVAETAVEEVKDSVKDSIDKI